MELESFVLNGDFSLPPESSSLQKVSASEFRSFPFSLQDEHLAAWFQRCIFQKKIRSCCMEVNQSSFKTCIAKGLIYSVTARDKTVILFMSVGSVVWAKLANYQTSYFCYYKPSILSLTHLKMFSKKAEDICIHSNCLPPSHPGNQLEILCFSLSEPTCNISFSPPKSPAVHLLLSTVPHHSATFSTGISSHQMVICPEENIS